MTQRNARAAGTEAATTAEVFGELLRHYRESAGLTQEALARLIPCDRSMVARVEAAKRVPQEAFAKACDDVLGTGGVLPRLWQRIDWYPEVEHPDWFERRARMDAEAATLREYQTQVVPGLLQTPEYAQAIFSRVTDGDELDERVRARLSRQQRFLAKNGPLYVVVLDESCLRNVVGGAEVMRGQCAHLLEVGRYPNIRIQVAPAGPTELVRPKTSLSLITLPDGADWLYTESLNSGHFYGDPSVLARYGQTYDVLRADALSAQASAALIGEAMKGFEQHAEAPAQRGDLDQEQLQRQRRRKLPRSRPRIPRPRPRT
ncbi:Scr1 family TA system antitoxin-like transcriptional regulator [Streptomyces sp. NPDC048018]|uniref:helix-turn-helix domain-containing protein n=1 Tax=Streptomyces sp. NPDC048018 TaxID=3365499 RepID=UPI0037173DD2